MSAEAQTIPDDISALAKACYLECEQMDTDGIVETISRFILAERKRCADIAASFSPGGERFEYHHDISTAGAVLKAIIDEA